MAYWAVSYSQQNLEYMQGQLLLPSLAVGLVPLQSACVCLTPLQATGGWWSTVH